MRFADLYLLMFLQLAELGLLPEGDADPMTLADKLTQLAIDANDDEVRHSIPVH